MLARCYCLVLFTNDYFLLILHFWFHLKKFMCLCKSLLSLLTSIVSFQHYKSQIFRYPTDILYLMGSFQKLVQKNLITLKLDRRPILAHLDFVFHWVASVHHCFPPHCNSQSKQHIELIFILVVLTQNLSIMNNIIKFKKSISTVVRKLLV